MASRSSRRSNSARDGIALIRDCGGVPVWAHPFLFRSGAVCEVFPELLDAGLMGIEVAHPHQGRKQRATLQELCDDRGLVATGGTDDHGPALGKPTRRYPKANALGLDRPDRPKAARATLAES